MGEIGGNDVSYAIKQGKSVEFLQEMVPEIVQSIKSAIDVSVPLHHKYAFDLMLPVDMTTSLLVVIPCCRG